MNEICDNILKADKKREIIGKIMSNEQKINELHTKCGSCDLWMTSQCKQEKTKKVSMNMPICGDFIPQKWTTETIQRLKNEVSDLLSVLNGL